MRPTNGDIVKSRSAYADAKRYLSADLFLGNRDASLLDLEVLVGSVGTCLQGITTDLAAPGRST
jgi:hypothetical protein